MEKYKVSVLLTIYNVGDYLEECLDSIINQSYKNLEIVCVNNGSQDNCEEILTAYKAKDDRIKVVSLQKNVKLCSGRNASLDNATGDLVCFVDPDDVIGKNYIQFMVNEFIAANKTNSINLVINPKAMNFENKKDERFLSNKLSEYNTEYLGNYIEDSNNFISKNNLIKSTRTDCIIPMWGRLYKLDFLKQINVRFIDGFMIDNIPFTAICNEHMEKWWITNNKLIPNETYYRRVELITFKDGTDLNEDPSGLGSITSNVLFKSFEMISCLDQWVKFAPHVKNPFFDIFFATYERHIFQSELFFKYQEFFDKYKNEITNSEMYTNLEKNFVFHISKLSYPDFNLYFFRYFKDQYLKSLIKTSTDDKKAIQLPKKVIYLFKKLELIKIKYITLDNKFIRSIYIFGIHLFNFEFVGNIIKVKIGEFEIVRVRKPYPPRLHTTLKVQNYFEAINLMRGLAIFFIVWGHIKGGLFLNSGADLSNSWWVIEKFIDTISIGGTSIFVFISGFLFYKIFYLRGFVYERFIISKCKKVLLPWFIIATTFTVMCLIKGYGHFSDVNFIYSSGYLYASFWYIPFIMVMFLCSPLHIKFIEGKDKIRIICLVLMTIFSMGLGRHNLNPFLSVIYWMPYYCFGIFIAIHYNIIISFSSNSKKSIFCLTILFLACLSSTNGQHLLKEYPPLKINLFESISFLVLGKYLLCICFLYFFEWFQKFSSNLVKRFLDILAKYSFSIFFLHQFVILHFERQPHKNLFSSMNFYEINLCAVFITILSIFACIAIAFLVKLIFGKYSRMIIGA